MCIDTRVYVPYREGRVIHLKEPHVPLTKMFLARSSFSQHASKVSISAPPEMPIRQLHQIQGAHHC